MYISKCSHLIEFLELCNLEENVLQYVLRIPLIFVQLGSHAQNFTTFPDVKLKVVIRACKQSQVRMSALSL